MRTAHSGAVSGGGRLRLLVGPGEEVAAEIWELVLRGDVALVRCSGRERAAQLQQLHVAVLPERRGMHSRDLEICRDLGTRVVAPRDGGSSSSGRRSSRTAPRTTAPRTPSR